MGKPIIQEDIDMIETLNIPNIIKVYKYINIFYLLEVLFTGVI